MLCDLLGCILFRRGGLDLECYGLARGVVQAQDLRDFVSEWPCISSATCIYKCLLVLRLLLKPNSAGSRSTDMLAVITIRSVLFAFPGAALEGLI